MLQHPLLDMLTDRLDALNALCGVAMPDPVAYFPTSYDGSPYSYVKPATLFIEELQELYDSEYYDRTAEFEAAFGQFMRDLRQIQPEWDAFHRETWDKMCAKILTDLGIETT